MVHVFEFVQSFSVSVLLLPVQVGREPNRDGFGKIFLGMALRIPALEVAHESLAIGSGAKTFRVFERRRAEYFLPAAILFEEKGMIQHMAHLMAQQPHAPGLGAPFRFQHHFFFEFLEAWMREVKRNRDSCGSFGAKPLITQIAEWPEGNSFRRELPVEILNPCFKFGSGNLELQVANADLQKLLVAQATKVRNRSGQSCALLVFGSAHPNYFNRVGQNGPLSWDSWGGSTETGDSPRKNRRAPEWVDSAFRYSHETDVALNLPRLREAKSR